ncbi:LuxR C-terminal-related transcriptional regulator [Nonomuraea sp. NPDC048826]|uniref:LuxR C-terminal-related transcriptional regulator n=1 Tax=Nonomuraea sp. NPDC048826 TaxID=3364347 RepID=UPI003723B18E
MITSLVVDGDAVRRQRLAGALRRAVGIDKVAAVGRPPENRPAGHGALVILLSLDVPGVDLAEAAQRHFPGTGMRGGLIAVVTGPEDRERLQVALHAGFRGVIFDGSPVEEVVTAVRAVAAGHPYIPPAMLNDIALAMLPLAVRLAERRDDPRATGTLTAREQEVLRLLAIGCPNEEIAEKLVITEATVRSHVLKILRKLGVRNRTEAVFIAHQRGLFGPLPYVPAAHHEPRGADQSDGVPVHL